MKKLFLFGLILLCFASRLNADEPPLLKLTIKTDKEKYVVGDEIKILYSLENLSDTTPLTLSYNIHPGYDYEIRVLGGKEFERFPVQGMRQTSVYERTERRELLPHQKLIGEEVIAKIKKGKVYKYYEVPSPGIMAEPRTYPPVTCLQGTCHEDENEFKKLYYEGFYISQLGTGFKDDLLIDEIAGKYEIAFKVCVEIKAIGDNPYCFKSDSIGIEIIN